MQLESTAVVFESPQEWLFRVLRTLFILTQFPLKGEKDTEDHKHIPLPSSNITCRIFSFHPAFVVWLIFDVDLVGESVTPASVASGSALSATKNGDRSSPSIRSFCSQYWGSVEPASNGFKHGPCSSFLFQFPSHICVSVSFALWIRTQHP